MTDVNDNAPEFNIPSTITVPENTAPNTPIYTVRATDIDQAQSSVVEYSLVTSQSGLFTIGKVDGVLKVTGNLDREKRDSYSIIIRASDKGSPSKSTDFTVQVLVGDANDHSPVFNPKTYSKTLDEDTPIGTKLLTVTATDGDIGVNGDIRYAIVNKNETQELYLDSHTGDLSIGSPLDFETKSNYLISVMAYDLGEPSMSDSATITITVEDVNDCRPAFLNVPYTVYVQEGVTSTPLYVTQVQATDCDSDYNAMLSYSITEGSGNGLFVINSETGVISANQVLDRESVASYEMVVSATDTGWYCQKNFPSAVLKLCLASHSIYNGILAVGPARVLL